MSQPPPPWPPPQWPPHQPPAAPAQPYQPQPETHPGQSYPAPAYQPPAYAPRAEPPPSSPRISRRPLILAALAGFALAAVIALILGLTGVLPSDNDSTGTDHSALSLPARLDSYVRFQDVSANQQARAKSVVAYRRSDDAATARQLSAAHDGATASVQSYSDQGLLTFFSVWAVRDSTPPPVVYVVPAKQVGTALPQQEIKQYGPVFCQQTTVQPTAAGQTPPPGSQITTFCQRSAHDLTVSLYGGTTADLFKHPTQVLALVNAAWDAVS